MKKILMVLIVLILMIITSEKVYAIQDSFYEGEYIPNTYMVKLKGNSGKYRQMKVTRRTSDNQIAYCTELWEGLVTEMVMPGYDNNQYLEANLDYNIWEKVMLISYYGYGYENHTDIKWYAITQFMIWKVTDPDSTVYFTDTLNGNRIDKYVEEMNEINNLIMNHANIPSFNNNNYQVKYNENLTITDTNNILDKFDVTSSNVVNYAKSGNNLTVSIDKIGESRIILTNRDKKYSTNPIIYVNENGQDVLTPGSYYPIYVVVDFNLPSKSLTINKLDLETGNTIQGDAKLQGSRFQLLDKNYNLISENTIGNDNKLVFENIGYGDYYLKEVTPGQGYLLNTEIKSLTVDDNTQNINFYNQVIKNKIVINKYLKDTLSNKMVPEESAIFTIYNSKNEKILTFNTNENGYYEFDLAYGNYTMKQELGKKNYSYIDDLKINITANNKVQTFDLYNERLYANINIINIDNESNLPILESGATFKIKDLIQDKYVMDKDNNILILTTNDLGKTISLPLESGKYQIEQIKAVDNYQIIENYLIFEISDEIEFKKENNENYLEVLIPNKKLKSIIEVEKIKEYYLNDILINSIVDNNIEIDIYAKEDIYSKDGLKIYDKDTVVDTAKLLDEVIKTLPLMFGNYYIKNPIDNTIIEILLNSIESKKIILTEKEYAYEAQEEKNEESLPSNEIKDTLPEIDKKEDIPEKEKVEDNNEIENIIPTIKVEHQTNNENEINQTDEQIINVPNTLDNKKNSNYLDIIIIIIGLIFIHKGKKYENN